VLLLSFDLVRAKVDCIEAAAETTDGEHRICNTDIPSRATPAS